MVACPSGRRNFQRIYRNALTDASNSSELVNFQGGRGGAWLTGGREVRRDRRWRPSDNLGDAMKAEDPGRVPGAVLGKALRRLSSGTGLIPILVMLR